MVNWRDLGEVPDSEEEDGFDTQESELVPSHEPTITQDQRGTATQTTYETDIWDVPESQETERPIRHTGDAVPPTQPPDVSIYDFPDSSPLSSAHSDVELDSIERLDLYRSVLDAERASVLSESQQHPSVEDGSSRSHVELSSSPPESFGGESAAQTLASSPPQSSRAPLPSQILGHDVDEQEARRAAVRYERFLRPRKPIQEHPYLLENAQYSSVLKEHGVRPLRMALEQERRRRQQHEASQDPDFEQESQESRELQISDESQVNGFEDPLGRLDTLDSMGSLEMASSSPPKTSPTNDRAGPSSQASSTDTHNTSLPGEDLPALEDLLRQQPRSTKKTPKRKASPPRSSTRKRRRHDVVDSDPLELDLEPAARFRLIPGAHDSPAARLSSRRSPDPLALTDDDFDSSMDQPLPLDPRLPESVRRPTTPPPPEPVLIDSDSDVGVADDIRGPASEREDSDSELSSESGSELVQAVGHRIRGVLPASWLRLDQQAARARAQAQKEAQKRHVNRSPERERRRGVAQKRIAVPGSSMAPQFLFDDSDDETPVPQQKTTDEIYHNQTRLILREDSNDLSLFSGFESDDGASVVEDNQIDHMLPSGKRQLKLSDSFRATPQRKTVPRTQRKSLSKGTRQSKITSLFEGSATTASASRNLIKEKHRHPITNSRSKGTKNRRPPPAPLPPVAPRLSILDVVEPDAPRFLKIAARAASRRRDQGRSSPTRKVIRLATREDHIDAISVLDDWKAGSIAQKHSVSVAKKAKQSQLRAPKPLGEKSANIKGSRTRPPMPPNGPLRKLVKHKTVGGTVSNRVEHSSTPPTTQRQPHRARPLGRSHSWVARPAQLELDEGDRVSRHTFNATKKRLDNQYRKQRGELSASSIFDLQTNRFEDQFPASPPPEDNPVPLRIVSDEQNDGQKSRYRKGTTPRRLDVEAPQYSRANDPIPVELIPVPMPQIAHVETEGDRLQGLGPYGTQYTHHFETFPLDSRVYFHESTLIGSGAVELVSNSEFCKRLLEPRSRVSFILGDQTLRWGPWDAQASSEMGILLDTVAEQLERASAGSETFDHGSMLGAVKFVTKYMMDALSLLQQQDAKAFVSRALEVFKSFDRKMMALVHDQGSSELSRTGSIATIYDYLLISVLLILKLCQHDATLLAEQFQTEELLKSFAKTSITALLTTGLDQVRKTFGDLQNARFRDRGIREDTPTVHSWVVVMKVMDHSQIPRASFWDIVYMVMAPAQTVASLDVQDHEQLWKSMFTLLPLSEFDDRGIIIPGRRHDASVDGWALPQKLLKRVFQLYRDNTRQGPSFNNYCRALVGRCHYLVQQWGWRKCVAVIGVIFDFFGSQNLAHLRNEEVYKSPRFLEELASNPSLAVDPDDRCFHVFLKLVALSIKKLRTVGSLNDIRNLVARILPNHNRQYLKEQTIHERDLAALRNHHDLLCTLFWASPPELRPAAHIIEGLVLPASSHKEACLINLRAWNQLSRFLVASGEATTSFKPFSQWMKTFFKQMVQQFDSVESDMHQQFRALSKETSTSISNDMFEAMVASNRAAVMDVLHFSVRASLDVMKHAEDLEAATFALNIFQLQQIFRHFTADSPKPRWAVLQAALDTLKIFLSRVAKFKEDEESQQSESQILNSAQADDAIIVIDNDLSKNFFSMARSVLSAGQRREPGSLAEIDKQACVEQVVIISAGLAVHFINGGLVQLSDMFKRGKYGLFDDVPANLDLDSRRRLSLFVATLLKQDFDAFADAGFTLCELWMLSIVKPRQYLEYESQLAHQLNKHQKEFLPEALRDLAVDLDYNTNRDLFEFAISWMRKSLREAGPALRKVLISDHMKTLKAVMQQIKGDLRVVVDETTEHPAYVSFVRDIIALICSHGSDICTVDDFFRQINKEYSPSMEDPQLRVAGMMSYGLRLSEGDSKVAYQLFFFLFNNFKMALINDKVGDEVKMLRQGMANAGIRGFIFGKMLPAIIRATSQDSTAFPMLDVYARALHLLLSESAIPYEVSEDELPHVMAMVKALLGALVQMSKIPDPFTPEQIHLVRQMVAILNDLWPSFFAMSVAEPAPGAWKDTERLLKRLRDGLSIAKLHIADTGMETLIIEPSLTFLSARGGHTDISQQDAQVTSFINNIVADVKKNWVRTENRISIQAGRATQSTQSGQGSKQPTWVVRELILDWYERLQEWNRRWKEVCKPASVVVRDHYMEVLF